LALADSLDAKDWRELQLAPIWILSAVGAADGKIDKAERAALVEGVNGCAAHSDPFVSQVFAATARNMDALWTDYMQDERFARHALGAVADVLDRVANPTQALHFKQTLVQLGVEVADASGGVLGMGGKRSKVEREALNKAGEALRLSSRRLISASQSGFQSVLVPLDGSPEAEAALSLARALAESFGAKVTLLRVVPEQRPPATAAVEGALAVMPMAPMEELRADSTAYLQSVQSTYGSPEWQATVADGPPADVICSQAERLGADVIVIATSGSAGARRLFESKVTEDVVRKSDVPVLVVPVKDEAF
jgi:nucleotide-binding universal stress UspA family protein